MIKTNDGGYNNRQLTYTVQCLSQLSTVQATPIEQTFDVTFQYEQCNASIFLLDNSGMPNYSQNWFSPTGLTDPVPEFQYTADCSLDFTYSAMVKDLSGVWKSLDEIKEIEFDPVTRRFALSKCWPLTA